MGSDPNLPASDDMAIGATSEARKLEVIAKSRNNLAVTSFMMAFETEEVMAFIEARATFDWPD